MFELQELHDSLGGLPEVSSQIASCKDAECLLPWSLLLSLRIGEVFVACTLLHAGCNRGKGNSSQQVHRLCLLLWQVCSLAGMEPPSNIT